MPFGWKVTRLDGTTFNGYRWPDEGLVEAANPIRENHEPCPSRLGDGLCVAKTFRGAASGGISARRGLILHYDDDDVLGEVGDMLRVAKVWVLGVVDVPSLIRSGEMAGADLVGADLRRADLSEAILSGADLSEAILSGADLRWAILSEAILSEAILSEAILSGADLSGADLRRADLSEAILSGADLRRADLSEAILSGWRIGEDGKAVRA